MLLDPDAFRIHRDQAVGTCPAGKSAATNPILHVLHANVLLRTLRQVNHAGPMQRNQCLFGIVFQALANHQHRFPVTVSVRIWIRNVRCQRNIARHLLPQITEFVARIPDVIARGLDGVSPRCRIVTRASWDHCASDIGLALKDADWSVEVFAGPVKVRRRRDLSMRRRPWISPRGHIRILRVQPIGRATHQQQDQ